MTISTRLTELLGIEHPVILAPMAAVSGGALAAAVSQAGGLGLIGGGYGDPDWIDAQYAAAGNARIGAGFITWSLAQRPDALDRVLRRSPVAVMLSFGDPTPFATTVRNAGAKLICQVQTIEDARVAAAAGADVIVAQGTEAGGHGGTRTTMSLVPPVVDAVAPIPVAAAGGIADGRGLAAALSLGAAGALLGTRFYATVEALGHPAAKSRLVASGGADTVRTSVFDVVRELAWPGQWTGRALRNAFVRRWAGREDELRADLQGAIGAFREAVRTDNFDEAAIMAGEGLDLIGAIEPAAAVLDRLVMDAEDTLRRTAATCR
jgi:nitronate monooxygenase